MTGWLEAAYRTPRSRLVASGFGGVFQLMAAAAEVGDLEAFRSHDHEWTTAIPNVEYARVDDITDLLPASGGGPAELGLNVAPRDGLRILRAVYRLAVIAWLLEGPGRGEIALHELAAARQLANHFRDPSVLTFVAGRAVEEASDKRVAWWKWLLKPAGEYRVVTTTFVPALITAYLSVLMDALPDGAPDAHLELPVERWIEDYRTMLRDGMGRAWPLQSEPSYWASRPDDAALADKRGFLVSRKLRVTHALDASVAEVERARTLRIRRAPVKEELRQLFIVTAQRAWATYRTIGPVLHALGAPQATQAQVRVPLVDRTVPKAGFVGETSNVHVTTYGQEVGVSAAGAEAEFVLRLLAQDGAPQRQTAFDLRAGLANRVMEAVAALLETGYAPSLVIAPGQAAVWSRLQIDPNREEIRRKLAERGVPRHLLRFVQAGIDGVPVLALRGLVLPAVIVVDSTRGFAVPGEFAIDGGDLDVTLLEPDAAAVEQELAEDTEIEQRAVGFELEQRLQQLEAQASAELRYGVADPDAIRFVWI